MDVGDSSVNYITMNCSCILFLHSIILPSLSDSSIFLSFSLTLSLSLYVSRRDSPFSIPNHSTRLHIKFIARFLPHLSLQFLSRKGIVGVRTKNSPSLPKHISHSLPKHISHSLPKHISHSLPKHISHSLTPSPLTP